MKRCSPLRGVKWLAIVGSLLLALGFTAFSVAPAAAQTRAHSSVDIASPIQPAIPMAPGINARFIRFTGTMYGRYAVATVHITGYGFRPYERLTLQAYQRGPAMWVTPAITYSDRYGRVNTFVSIRPAAHHQLVSISTYGSWRHMASTRVYIP